MPVSKRVVALCGDDACQVVLLNGGTGLGPRDTAYEAITGILEKRLDGFGELFRVLSQREVGAAAMLSRAIAGVYGYTLVFSMPESTDVVRLAMDELILRQIGHAVWGITPLPSGETRYATWPRFDGEGSVSWPRRAAETRAGSPHTGERSHEIATSTLLSNLTIMEAIWQPHGCRGHLPARRISVGSYGSL